MTNEDKKKAAHKEKIKQLKIRLKEKVFEHLSTTHLHGLPHIVRSKYWYMKVFWIFWILLMFSISLWLIVLAYQSYFAYPVLTSIKKYVDMEQNFPTVTICNLEPFLTKSASDYIEKSLPDNFNFTVNSLEKLVEVRKSILDKLSANYFTLAEKQSFGYLINETLINCQFDGSLCSNTSEEFTWYYSYKYANCFAFNTGFTYLSDAPNENSTKYNRPIKRVSRAGADYGLSLELYAGSRDARYSLEQYGLVVFIHNQSSLPESSSGIVLKPGTQTSIGVEKSFNSYTPYPYSECQDLSSFKFDRIYYDAILQASLTYTQSLCLDLCLRQAIVRKCNCSYLEFIQIHDSLPCSTDSELNCAESLYYSFLDENGVHESCSTTYHCPLECESQQYYFTVSTSGYPTESYANILMRQPVVLTHYNSSPTIDQIREDTLKLNIYFDSDKYTLIEQTGQYKPYDLFANTGGIVNLFHGLSILCLVQVFDFLFEISMILWNNRTRKSKYIPRRRGGLAEDTAILELVRILFFFICFDLVSFHLD